MPVIADVFTPRTRLTAAEAVVRWKAINRAIVTERDRIEKATVMRARRLGFLVGSGVLAPVQLRELAAELTKQLVVTYDFGRREAQAEIARLRASRPGAARVTAALEDARPRKAKRRFADRATEAAQNVEQAARQAPDQIAASAAASRQLHLEVLTLVGESLNLGRAEGAANAVGGPPQFAMRSEQLDRNSCPRCISLHGTIVQIDSDEFARLMPPAECYGGGRCRGVYVFGDGPGDLGGTGYPTGAAGAA